MKKTIKLTESDLTKLVQATVKSVLREMNEISSDMIQRASRKFDDKYGYGGTERDNLEKDKYGNPLHPKDKKPIADHLRNFNRAYNERHSEEQLQDPVVAKAQEIYDGGIDWEQEIEDRDGGGAFGSVWGSAEDENGGLWEFWGGASFEWEGGWEPVEISDVEFKSPDGKTGFIPRP
jgi:hypothetical protein